MRKPALVLLALALGFALPACRSSGDVAVPGSPEPTVRAPDRVLFQIAARDWQSPDAVLAELRSSIDNIRATWPSVNIIDLIPIVGGAGGGARFDPIRPPTGGRASLMYPGRSGA